VLAWVYRPVPFYLGQIGTQDGFEPEPETLILSAEDGTRQREHDPQARAPRCMASGVPPDT
jgi:hypothetical protein